MTGDSFLEFAEKEFGFLLGLHAIKLLWWNANIQILSALPYVNGTLIQKTLSYNRWVCSVLSQV